MLYRRDADRGIEPLSASDRQHPAACTVKRDNSSACSSCMEGANLAADAEDLRSLRPRGRGWSARGLSTRPTRSESASIALAALATGMASRRRGYTRKSKITNKLSSLIWFFWPTSPIGPGHRFLSLRRGHPSSGSNCAPHARFPGWIRGALRHDAPDRPDSQTDPCRGLSSLREGPVPGGTYRVSGCAISARRRGVA